MDASASPSPASAAPAVDPSLQAGTPAAREQLERCLTHAIAAHQRAYNALVALRKKGSASVNKEDLEHSIADVYNGLVLTEDASRVYGGVTVKKTVIQQVDRKYV